MITCKTITDDDLMEYDEFGFKIEVEDGPEQCSSKLLSTPFSDNHQQKLKWIAHLVKVLDIFEIWHVCEGTHYLEEPFIHTHPTTLYVSRLKKFG